MNAILHPKVHGKRKLTVEERKKKERKTTTKTHLKMKPHMSRDTNDAAISVTCYLLSVIYHPLYSTCRIAVHLYFIIFVIHLFPITLVAHFSLHHFGSHE